MGIISYLQKALSAGHDWREGFDDDVCYGRREDYPDECPKLNGGSVDTCGVCGCTIVGLDMTDTPPSKCVRREGHDKIPVEDADEP